MRWQLSHAAVVGIWFAGLPRAVAPLWQVAHEPGTTPVWLNVAPVKLVVLLWHVSHAAVVAT